MRHHVADLRGRGVRVETVALDEGRSFPDGLAALVYRLGVTELAWMRAADRGTDASLRATCERLGGLLPLAAAAHRHPHARRRPRGLAVKRRPRRPRAAPEGRRGHVSVNRWFLSLFVDAYPWVMVANVMGMSQFADGGLVGTKPYVSGGAYLQRMGRWWSSERAARESTFTEAYWAFHERHERVLAGNHRLAQPLAQMRQRRAERGG